MKRAHVHFDPARGLLIGTFDDGATYASVDPRELAELMFAAGGRHGHITMPDWREGDAAPHAGQKTAFSHRLNQLERGNLR